MGKTQAQITGHFNHFKTFHSRFTLTIFYNTVRKRKKSRCKTPYKIMTDNQNMNKTSMKHVQQQHFIQDIK